MHIESYKSTYPNNKPFFRLLSHKPETILRKYKALFYAPLFNINKLTGYDVIEHPLETLVGRNLSYSTLTQFTGDLERVKASNALMPMLSPTEKNECCYIDGNMKEYWSKKSMHKGKITMLGRIMGGSQAVVTHVESGQSIYFEYHPPDTRLPVIIEAYCRHIVETTGIRNFIIDREINSVAVAKQFDTNKWGLLSMLDSNEYKGLSDWTTTLIGKLEDGSEVHEGKWRSPKKADDPRTFVIVVEKTAGKDKLLPFWGTPELVKSIPLLEWPEKYFQRIDTQENGFKRMIKYCGADTNHGIKKVLVADRHQERKKEKLEKQLSSKREKIETSNQKISEQKEKVEESIKRKHTKRLEQRKIKLQNLESDLKDKEEGESTLVKKLEKLQDNKQRYDRNFDKQNIMMQRSLLLDNKLMTFLKLLISTIGEKISIDELVGLFFKRSGTCYEIGSALIYFVNSRGLSFPKKLVLERIAKAVNMLGLYHQGKIIEVRIRNSPG